MIARKISLIILLIFILLLNLIINKHLLYNTQRISIYKKIKYNYIYKMFRYFEFFKFKKLKNYNN